MALNLPSCKCKENWAIQTESYHCGMLATVTRQDLHNWQAAWPGSEQQGFPAVPYNSASVCVQGQLSMLSGGLPLSSLGSFGKLSALPSLGTLGSVGRSNGNGEAPRFGGPRLASEGAGCSPARVLRCCPCIPDHELLVTSHNRSM